MIEWKEKLDAFLKFNEREILEDSGKVSMEVAQCLAVEEYEKFSQRRLAEDTTVSDTDFDTISKKIEQKKRENQKKRH